MEQGKNIVRKDINKIDYQSFQLYILNSEGSLSILSTV